MIPKVKLLGQYWQTRAPDSNVLRLNTTLKEGLVLLLRFQCNNGTCQYLGIDTIQFDQEKNKKLLLKTFSGRRLSEFPTILIDKKMEKGPIKLHNILKNAANINPDIRPLLECYVTNQPRIVKELSTRLSPEGNNIVSLLVNDRFVGESPLFQPIVDKVLNAPFEAYYHKYKTTSRANDQVCYVCDSRKNEIWGFADTFAFYSANEFAYIAGGFEREKSWRNYPVCPDCARLLQSGRDFLEKHLNFTFYGNNYYLIPAPTMDTSAFVEALDILKDEFKAFKMNRDAAKTHKQIVEVEEDVFATLAKQKNSISFSLFFYKTQNSEFKIMQEIQDVLPSRFRQIIDAKESLRKFPEFQGLKGIYKKDEGDDLSFDFGILRTFFDKDFNKAFLELTARIFKDKPIEKQFILHRISDYLAEKYRKDELYHEFFKAMLLMKFLYHLQLIKNEPLKKEVNMANMFEDYFQMHPEFFDADIKKALFLEGLLVEKLLNIQFTERGSKPFRSRLNGLKIDSRTVKRLLPEAIEKLEQYKKNYYKDLESLISTYLVAGEPDLKKMTVDEISFYFVMGMNLAKMFKPKEEEGGTENE